MSPTSKIVIQSYASKKGWGKYCQKVSTGGQWSLLESKVDISVLELLAVKLALLTFSEIFNLRSIHFQVNNMSALLHLMKMGGIQNKEMIAISKEILEFALSREIMITAKYLPGRLGFQKFPRLKRMATISKSIPKNLCKVAIPRSGSFYIKSIPSDSISPVVKNRSTQPSNICIPTKLETSRATVCFSPFFNNRKSFIKGQNRGRGCNSNNTKLASTTLIESGSGIICNQTSASTSFKKHLSTGGPQKCSYFSLAITFTKIRKPSIFFLRSYWKFIEFFWWKSL